MDQRPQLQAIRDNPALSPRVRRSAEQRIAALDKQAAKPPRVTRPEEPVRKYRVGGVWKLTRAIGSHAGWDSAGNETFGYSDRV